MVSRFTGIDLHLMASHINEGLDQRCHFGNALLTAEQRIMQFNGERASVNGMLQTRTGKGFVNGNRPLAVDKQTGRVIQEKPSPALLPSGVAPMSLEYQR